MRALFPILFLGLFAGMALSAEVHTDGFFREANITLNYSKIPWVLRGITPVHSNPQQLLYDEVVIDDTPVRLDPRTCPGEMAICYQIRKHTYAGEITYGKNYTGTGSYTLPDVRVKYRYCVGTDTKCVQESTSCFCPKDDIPKPPPVFGQLSKCTDTNHICRDTFGTFAICEGKLDECQEEYPECGCGRYSVCRADKHNVCINERKELYNCQGSLYDCLGRYGTCFCGDYMLNFQNPCEEYSHACQRGGINKTCYGQLEDCALLFDSCTCGGVE